MRTKRGPDMISTSTALVHVPREAVVYDSASPLYRFLHKQVSKVKAVLSQKGLPAPIAKIVSRYTYKGRHFQKPGEPQETRVRDAQGNDNGQRFQWVSEPT